FRLTLKELDENWCRKSYNYVACKEKYEHVEYQDGFTHDDEPDSYAGQHGSGALDIVKDSYEVMKDANRSSAGAQVEETNSTREIKIEKDNQLLISKYVKLKSSYKELEAYVEIAKKSFPVLSFSTPNAKDTSVCDDVGEPDAATNYNAKATSVRDDVGVHDDASNYNAKATSVRDDVGVLDDASDYNAKATRVCDDVGVPDAASDYNAKAMSVRNDVGVPDVCVPNVCDDIDEVDDNAKRLCVFSKPKSIEETHSSQVPIFNVYNTPVDNEDVFMKDAHDIILFGGLEKTGDGLDKA
nr:hypothetical protein [Tanacetum cinerariifolium]